MHVCLIDASLDWLNVLTGTGKLAEDWLIRAVDRNEAGEMFILAEQITQRPERHHVGLQCWSGAARTRPDIAISVPSV